jgi:hypothetical protein
VIFTANKTIIKKKPRGVEEKSQSDIDVEESIHECFKELARVY